MTDRLLRHIPRWLPSIGGLTLLIVLTLLPARDMPQGPALPGLDKAVHLLMFGLVTAAILFDIARSSGRINYHIFAVAASAMIILGALIEWAQSEMGCGRSGELLDLAADAVGVVIIPLLLWPLLKKTASLSATRIHTMPTITENHIESLRELYEASFPEEERRPWPDLLERLRDPSDRLQVSIVSHRDAFAGFITSWQLNCGYRYIEHFAITPNLRSAGIGSKALQQFVGEDSTPVVLEVEPASSTTQADSRIAFYRRNGFIPHDTFSYTQPPYSSHLPEVDLTLMTTDTPSHATLQQITADLHHTVYGR